jgi:hypothetical protein
MLAGRRCYPCPDAAILCSPLAVLSPPHTLVGSLFPQPYQTRGLLVYSTLLRCLNPSACNAPPEVPLAGDNWTAWLTQGASLPERSEHVFQCRTGHDPASFKCSRCLSGFYLNGFLCESCPRVSWLFSLAVMPVLLLGYLVFIVKQASLISAPFASASSRPSSPSESTDENPMSGREQQTAPEHISSHYLSLALFFLQVCARSAKQGPYLTHRRTGLQRRSHVLSAEHHSTVG